jgi:hypothetical protein
MVESGVPNSNVDHVALMFWLLTERFLAIALVIVLASRSAETTAVTTSFEPMRI